MSLHTVEPPSGRCLLLGQELHKATDLGGDAPIRMAKRLFDGQYPRDRPAIIRIPASTPADGLRAICEEVGIVVEIAVSHERFLDS